MEISNRTSIYLNKGFLLVFFSLIVLMLVLIFSNSDIRGVESNSIYTLQQILDDNSFLYQDPTNFPFPITTFTPIYFLLCDGILTILRIDSDNVLMIRIIARSVSILILMSTVFIFYKILSQQFKLNKKNSVIFSSLFIVFTFPWNSLSRPDVLVLFFIMLSFFLILKHFSINKKKYIFLIGVFSFLAFASKQNGLVLPLVFFVFFLIRKEWISLLLLGSGTIGGLLFLGLVLYAGNYDMSFLKTNIIDGVNNQIDIIYAIKYPYKDFLIYFGPFCIVFYLVVRKNIKDWLNPLTSLKFLFVLSFIFWFLLSVLFAVKTGSGVNYFNELLVVMLLIVAYELSNKNNTISLIKGNAFNLLLAVGIQVCIIHGFNYIGKISRGIYETYFSQDTSRQETVNFLNENINDHYFFSEDKKINLAIHNKCILPQLDIHNSSLAINVFDYTNLEYGFKSGKIKYLILFSELRPILNIDVKDFYELQKEIGGFKIYKFKE